MSGAPDGNNTFFGFMGVACALVFANLGAAYGTAKSGVGIASMGVLKPDLIIKSIIPVVMAGILGIYGLIVSVILIQKSKILINVSYWSIYSSYGYGTFSIWIMLWFIIISII